MKLTALALISAASAKGGKLSDILDLAKLGKNDNDGETSLYATLRARHTDDATRTAGLRRQGDRWEALWLDGAIPGRPPVGVYPGAIVTSTTTINDVGEPSTFEGVVVTWDCGNAVSLTQTLTHGTQAAQAVIYADVAGTAYSIPGLIMDYSTAAQEKCPAAIPAPDNGLLRDQMIAWRRVAGSPDVLLGRVFTTNTSSGRAVGTNQYRILRNTGQQYNFDAVQILTNGGRNPVVYAAYALRTNATAQNPNTEFEIIPRGMVPTQAPVPTTAAAATATLLSGLQHVSDSVTDVDATLERILLKKALEKGVEEFELYENQEAL